MQKHLPRVQWEGSSGDLPNSPGRASEQRSCSCWHSLTLRPRPTLSPWHQLSPGSNPRAQWAEGLPLLPSPAPPPPPPHQSLQLQDQTCSRLLLRQSCFSFRGSCWASRSALARLRSSSSLCSPHRSTSTTWRRERSASCLPSREVPVSRTPRKPLGCPTPPSRPSWYPHWLNGPSAGPGDELAAEPTLKRLRAHFIVN